MAETLVYFHEDAHPGENSVTVSSMLLYYSASPRGKRQLWSWGGPMKFHLLKFHRSQQVWCVAIEENAAASSDAFLVL